MNVLVACEFSGIVRNAFRALGHNAWSCDIIESLDHSPYHIQGDVLEYLNLGWDLMIAHPPCTHLSSSGAAKFAVKRLDGRQQQGIDFFMQFVNSDVTRIAIENPVGIMSTRYRKPDQIVQPWQFGHYESKGTCLWLKGLLPLVYTDVVHPEWHKNPDGTFALTKSGKRTAQNHNTPKVPDVIKQSCWKMGPSPNRSMLRSITYEGIAAAMAEQWGGWTL